jgi:hypothetical protein
MKRRRERTRERERVMHELQLWPTAIHKSQQALHVSSHKRTHEPKDMLSHTNTDFLSLPLPCYTYRLHLELAFYDWLRPLMKCPSCLSLNKMYCEFLLRLLLLLLLLLLLWYLVLTPPPHPRKHAHTKVTGKWHDMCKLLDPNHNGKLVCDGNGCEHMPYIYILIFVLNT